VFRRASDGAEISYDYGWYSNALAPDATNLTESLRCRESIGGLPATIVTGRLSDSTAAAGRHVAAAAWRNVERDDQPVHLTIWTSTPDSAEIEMLRGVLQSVRFDVDE
jgi:hypothetical protein